MWGLRQNHLKQVQSRSGNINIPTFSSHVVESCCHQYWNLSYFVLGYYTTIPIFMAFFQFLLFYLYVIKLF